MCVDGYWTDLTKNACPGELTPEYHKLLDLLLKVFHEAVNHARDGASLPDLDRLIRARIAEGGYAGQPSHAICHGVGARASREMGPRHFKLTLRRDERVFTRKPCCKARSS